MMRLFARLLMLLGATTVFGVTTLFAQTPNTATPSDVGYAELTFGPTFGHKASASVGGEGGYWLTVPDDGMIQRLGLFGEAGVMNNVATSTIDAKAKKIADTFNGTARAKPRAVYVDGGVIARFPAHDRFTPYALFGLGVARVTNRTTFAVNGANLTTAQLVQLGVQLGADLAGSYSKLFVTVGGGAHVAVTGRWIADISYRYGRIGGDTPSETAGVNTNRLQFGIGAKF
jgi:opacity protein-like surface antigen